MMHLSVQKRVCNQYRVWLFHPGGTMRAKAIVPFMIDIIVCSVIVIVISKTQINKYDGYDRSIVIQPVDTCGIPVTATESFFLVPGGFHLVNFFSMASENKCNYKFEILLRDGHYEPARAIPISFSEQDLKKENDDDYWFSHEMMIDSAETFGGIGTVRYQTSFGYMSEEKDENGALPVLTKESTIVIRDQYEERVITNADGFDVVESSNNYPVWFSIKDGPDGYGYISVTNRWFLEKSNAISVVLSGILGAILSQYFNRKAYIYYYSKIKALRDFFYYG